MSVNIGIFGAGIVAGGVVEILDAKRAEFAASGLNLVIKAICCRDIAKPRDFIIDSSVTLTSDPAVILNDTTISIVVELMGGLGLAKEVILTAIASGKHVITANKALLASEMDGIIAAVAAKPSVRLGFEAAVGGGLPIIRLLQQSLVTDTVTRVAGIINGTTNFMLSAMDKDGVSYADILKRAQELGYAESDPTADVGGWDAQAKLLILAKLSFGVTLSTATVPAVGITALTPGDFEVAKSLGCTIKLLGVSFVADGTISAIVSPHLVSLTNPVGQVNGATNVVQVKSKSLGDSTFIGSGAGRYPTANSVVADIINIAQGTSALSPFPRPSPSVPLAFNPDYNAPWYIRLTTSAADKAFKLAALTADVASAGLSITGTQEVVAADGTITLVVLTSPATRSAILALPTASEFAMPVY